jgi:hypothetical protein
MPVRHGSPVGFSFSSVSENVENPSREHDGASQAHGQIHGEYLDGAGTNPEQTGQHAGKAHQTETERNPADGIRGVALRTRIAAIQAQPCAQRFGRGR